MTLTSVEVSSIKHNYFRSCFCSVRRNCDHNLNLAVAWNHSTIGIFGVRFAQNKTWHKQPHGENPNSVDLIGQRTHAVSK